LSDASPDAFYLARPSRRVSRETSVARSSPLIVLASTFWLAFVLSGVGAYFFLKGANLYYPFVALFIPFFLLSRLPQILRLGFNAQFWLWILTILVPFSLYVLGQSGANATASLKQRVIFFSMVAGSAVVLGAPDARRMLRAASLIVLAWAIPICFIELLIPNLFSTAEGRSAGLYGNPNDASMAILLCLLLAVDITRQTTRSLLLVSLGVAAVFTTFSRSGMLFATILLGIHAFFPSRDKGSLRGPQRVIVIGTLVVFSILVVINLSQQVSLSGEAAMRLRSVFTGDISDNSTIARQSVALQALDLIERNLWGNGLGFVDGMERLPHNTFLYIAVDYGIPGAFFYLTLLVLGLRRSLKAGWQRGSNGVMLALLLIYSSFFTHYVMGTTFFSVAFAALLTGALVLPEATGAPSRQARRAGASWES